MSAERGWIGERQPAREWHASRYSRMADKIFEAEQQRIREAERWAAEHGPRCIGRKCVCASTPASANG